MNRNEIVASVDIWAGLLSDPEVSERGGEDNNDGVDFARYWAIYLLIALERTRQEDYVLLFEYLQDVALLNSTQAPTSAALYQLKKRDRKDWSISSLCKADDGQKADSRAGSESSQAQADLFSDVAPTGQEHISAPKSKSVRRKSAALRGQSPLGKLYLSVAKLTQRIDATGVFVSNAPLGAKMSDGRIAAMHSIVRLHELHSTETSGISDRLRKELGLNELAHISKLSFEHTKLQPATMRETVRGVLGEFLVDELRLTDTSGQLVVKLFEAFSRLGGKKQNLQSLREIVSEKGFTKEMFSRLLESASHAGDFGEQIDEMISDLKREGLAPKKANKIADAARRIAIRFVRAPEQRDVMCWQDALRFARVADTTTDSYLAMLDLTERQLTTFLASGSPGSVSSTDTRAVALLANIHVRNESQTTSPQSTEEEQ
jgi:hypothetical protein